MDIVYESTVDRITQQLDADRSKLDALQQQYATACVEEDGREAVFEKEIAVVRQRIGRHRLRLEAIETKRPEAEQATQQARARAEQLVGRVSKFTKGCNQRRRRIEKKLTLVVAEAEELRQDYYQFQDERLELQVLSQRYDLDLSPPPDFSFNVGVIGAAAAQLTIFRETVNINNARVKWSGELRELARQRRRAPVSP